MSSRDDDSSWKTILDELLSGIEPGSIKSFDDPKPRSVHRDPSPAEEAYFEDSLPDHCVCRRSSTLAHTCPVFACYDCHCGSWWRSGNSWYEFAKRKAYTQKCKKCEAAVAPRWFLRKKEHQAGQFEKRGPHDTARCERCKELGADCSLLARRL